MKRAIAFLVILTCISSVASAQFRPESHPTDDQKISDAKPISELASESGGFFSQLFDPNRLSSHQTYSFSYSSFGGQSIGVSAFTNTFSYRVSNNMMISADVSAVYSPFNSLANSSLAKDINGVYLSNARLDWKLGDATFLTISYNRGYDPYSGFDYYNPFYSSTTPGAAPISAPGAQPAVPVGTPHTTSAKIVH